MRKGTRQFQKTEEDIQLTKLADMGVIYIEKAAEVSTMQAKENVLAWIQDLQDREPPEPMPSQAEIKNKYLDFLRIELEKYVPGFKTIIELQESSFQYKVATSLGNDINYTITPSVDATYNDLDSVEGSISIQLDFS